MSLRRAGVPALSVLIPALNEAETLPLLLADIAGQRGIDIEVIVADGGSADATAAIAARHGALVVAAVRGRAAQLNAAVAAARAGWLLCLHADSRLSELEQLRRALGQLLAEQARGGIVAGHWPLRFLRAQPGHDALFRQLEAKSASNRPGTVNGDQGLLIHSETLATLGGFDESLPFFEDQRLAAKVFARGRFLLLPDLLHTSARRFETEGHRARLLLMALIVGAEAAGLDDWLASLPALYRGQKEATQLRAAPFIDSLLAHIAGLPRARQREVWKSAGQLVAANAWQLAQWRDAQRAGGRWLARFDMLLAPLFATPLASRSIALALPRALRLLARVSG